MTNRSLHLYSSNYETRPKIALILLVYLQCSVWQLVWLSLFTRAEKPRLWFVSCSCMSTHAFEVLLQKNYTPVFWRQTQSWTRPILLWNFCFIMPGNLTVVGKNRIKTWHTRSPKHSQLMHFWLLLAENKVMLGWIQHLQSDMNIMIVNPINLWTFAFVWPWACFLVALAGSRLPWSHQSGHVDGAFA